MYNHYKIKKNCIHQKVFEGKNKFCKTCGSLITNSLGIGFKNFEKCLKINPNKIYKNLLLNQDKNWYFNENPYHWQYRKLILKKIKDIFSQLNYSKKTEYLTICYLDSILSRYKIEIFLIDLVLLICISFSSKFEEKNNESFNMNSIFLNFRNQYSMSFILNYEKIILKYLNFNLYMILPLDFFQFFNNHGIIYENEIKEKYENNYNNLYNFENYKNNLVEKIIKLNYKLINLSIYNYSTYQFTPLTISTSCIANSRKLLGFKKWNKELEDFTYIKFIQITECYKLIKNLFLSKKDNKFKNFNNIDTTKVSKNNYSKKFIGN